MFNLTQSTNNASNLDHCIFGPEMAKNLKEYPWLMTSYYLSIITIFLAVLLLGKAIEGTRFTFVFIIAILIIVNNIADIVYYSTFICQPKFWAIKNDGTYYWYWDVAYVIVMGLCDVHNYLFIVYNYKLGETRAKMKLNLRENELINQIKIQENKTEEELFDF